MTDFRALCAELLCSLEQYPVQPPRDRDLIERARAALAQPEPQGPTDEAWQWYSYCPEDGIELHLNKELAQKAAQGIMGSYAKAAHSDGWHEDMESVSWGMLLPVERAQITERTEAEPDSDFDEWIRYELVPSRYARPAALAQPEPQGPTNAQIDELAAEYLDGDRASVRDFARAVLVRWWGNSIITPDGPAVPNGREPASVAHQPTDKELLELMPEAMRDEFAAVSNVYSTATGGQVKPGLFRVVLNTVALEYARAALARWGRPTIKPVPVTERLPGPADCDEEGRCFVWDHVSAEWRFLERDIFDYGWPESYWLPHYVLPVPQQENKQ